VPARVLRSLSPLESNSPCSTFTSVEARCTLPCGRPVSRVLPAVWPGGGCQSDAQPTGGRATDARLGWAGV